MTRIKNILRKLISLKTHSLPGNRRRQICCKLSHISDNISGRPTLLGLDIGNKLNLDSNYSEIKNTFLTSRLSRCEMKLIVYNNSNKDSEIFILQ